eukprot:3196881-Rhodomonas_salina.1
MGFSGSRRRADLGLACLYVIACKPRIVVGSRVRGQLDVDYAARAHTSPVAHPLISHEVQPHPPLFGSWYSLEPPASHRLASVRAEMRAARCVCLAASPQ